MKGVTADDDKTIPSFLARDLNQSEFLPSYLINFGEPSFNSLMETKYLQKALSNNLFPPTSSFFTTGPMIAPILPRTGPPTPISAIADERSD
jgi:hypothetical protein